MKNLGIILVASAAVVLGTYVYFSFRTTTRSKKGTTKKKKKISNQKESQRQELQSVNNETNKVNNPVAQQRSNNTHKLVNLLHQQTGDESEGTKSDGVLCTLSHNDTAKVLTTLANNSSFTDSQDIIRELGGLQTILELLKTTKDPTVLLKSIWASSNLAVNAKNQEILIQGLPSVSFVLDQVDTKIPITANEIDQEYRSQVTLMSLRFVLNLSMNEDSHPHILKTSIPSHVIDLLSKSHSKDIRFKALQNVVNLTCNKETTFVLLSMQLLENLFPILEYNDFETLRRVLLVATKILSYLDEKPEEKKQLATKYAPHFRWMMLKCETILDDSSQEQEVLNLATTLYKQIFDWITTS